MKKWGVIIILIVVSLFFITGVSGQIPVLKLNETTNGTASTKTSIFPIIELKNPANISLSNVNRSIFWGSYLWSDYDMPTIESFSYNQTLAGSNLFLRLDNSNQASWTPTTTLVSNLNTQLWNGNQFATYLNQPVLTTSEVLHDKVQATNGLGMKDSGSSYYTYHKQLYATPYNTVDRNIYWSIGNADRTITLLGNLRVEGSPTINQSLTQTDNIGVQNITANNITLRNLYVSGTIGNSTNRYTWAELNKTIGDNLTNVCMLNQSNNFGNNNVSIKYFNVSEMNYYGGNVSFFTKSTTGTGSNNGDALKICNPAENRCGEIYIDQYGRLVVSIPNDDLFFTATGAVTIEDFSFDATTMGSNSDVLIWSADSNKNGQGQFSFLTSTTETFNIQNQSSTFYGNLSVIWNVTVGGLAGTGNAYACVDSSGKLYRSAVACV